MMILGILTGLGFIAIAWLIANYAHNRLVEDRVRTASRALDAYMREERRKQAIEPVRVWKEIIKDKETSEIVRDDRKIEV